MLCYRAAEFATDKKTAVVLCVSRGNVDATEFRVWTETGDVWVLRAANAEEAEGWVKAITDYLLCGGGRGSPEQLSPHHRFSDDRSISSGAGSSSSQIIRGLVLKRSAWTHTWNSRYVVVDGLELRNYETEQSTSERNRSYLGAVDRCEDGRDLQVTTTDGASFLMRFEQAETARTWHRTLRGNLVESMAFRWQTVTPHPQSQTGGSGVAEGAAVTTPSDLSPAVFDTQLLAAFACCDCLNPGEPSLDNPLKGSELLVWGGCSAPLAPTALETTTDVAATVVRGAAGLLGTSWRAAVALVGQGRSWTGGRAARAGSTDAPTPVGGRTASEAPVATTENPMSQFWGVAASSGDPRRDVRLHNTLIKLSLLQEHAATVLAPKPFSEGPGAKVTPCARVGAASVVVFAASADASIAVAGKQQSEQQPTAWWFVHGGYEGTQVLSDLWRLTIGGPSSALAWDRVVISPPPGRASASHQELPAVCGHTLTALSASSSPPPRSNEGQTTSHLLLCGGFGSTGDATAAVLSVEVGRRGDIASVTAFASLDEPRGAHSACRLGNGTFALFGGTRSVRGGAANATVKSPVVVLLPRSSTWIPLKSTSPLPPLIAPPVCADPADPFGVFLLAPASAAEGVAAAEVGTRVFYAQVSVPQAVLVLRAVQCVGDAPPRSIGLRAFVFDQYLYLIGGPRALLDANQSVTGSGVVSKAETGVRRFLLAALPTTLSSELSRGV